MAAAGAPPTLYFARRGGYATINQILISHLGAFHDTVLVLEKITRFAAWH